MSPEKLYRIPAAHLQAILHANFDSRSLANRLAGHGYPGLACCHTYDLAGRAWADNSCFRHALAWLLDRMHGPTLIQTGHADLDLLARYAHTADYRKHPNLGGLLWALQSDPRSELQEHLNVLLRRIHHDAFRSLSA